jgi:hypothetical protein
MSLDNKDTVIVLNNRKDEADEKISPGIEMAAIQLKQVTTEFIVKP